MTENLTEAAILTVLGILVVFVSLASLMVAIIILSRLTSRKGPEATGKAPPVEVQETSISGKESVPSKEPIAAIAVALARSMAETERVRPGPHEGSLPPGASKKWASAGREELMRSRRKVGHRWGRTSR